MEERAEIYMSTVSLGEFYNVVSRELGTEIADRKYLELKNTGIIFVSPDEETALLAGRLKTKYSKEKRAFALADAFCLATALKKEAKIITGDLEFSSVTECEIIWVASNERMEAINGTLRFSSVHVLNRMSISPFRKSAQFCKKLYLSD